MKKLISVVIAASIVLGMAATAFAAETSFYLANRELQLEDEVEPYEPSDVPANANANPGTGF